MLLRWPPTTLLNIPSESPICESDKSYYNCINNKFYRS